MYSPATGKQVAKEKNDDRHKNRRTVRPGDDLYAKFEELAERNHRPVIWEFRMALRAWLRQHGLLEDDPEDDTAGDGPKGKRGK